MTVLTHAQAAKVLRRLAEMQRNFALSLMMMLRPDLLTDDAPLPPDTVRHVYSTVRSLRSTSAKLEQQADELDGL